MKRFVLLLLLALLPLQTASAAGVAHCPQDAGDGVYAAVAGDLDATHAHGHDSHDGGHVAGPDIDCSAFQFVALEPPVAREQLLSRGGATACDVAHSDYKSHIPGGLDRPKWRLAA